MWSNPVPRREARPSAVIVEDEPALARELRELLQQQWPALDIASVAGDGVQALRDIAQHAPDVAFLDIQIPDPNGLDVARLVGERCHVVFVTAYDAHAIEAFEAGAADYLLKPLDPQRLARTVQRLQKTLGQRPPDLSRVAAQAQAGAQRSPYLRWITATVGNALRLITTDEVVFFQSDQKYTRVVLADSEVLIRKTLKELMAELDPEQFWQLHRSTLVNAQEVQSIEPNLAGQLAVRLRSRREQLPVSEAFLRRFRTM